MDAAEVEVDLEMRDSDHVAQLVGALRDRGYDVEVLV
jgi:hypothetical protein